MCLLFGNSASTRKICRDWFVEKTASIDPDYFDEIMAEFDQEINSKYIDPSTRAVRLSLYMFDISENNFISLEPVNLIFPYKINPYFKIIEFTPLGTVLAYIPRITLFKPNLKENTPVPHNVLNIFIVIFATFLLLFVLYTLFTSGNGGINLGYFITLQGLLNTLIIILCYVVHTMIDQLNGFDITQEQLLTDTTLTVNIFSYTQK